MRRSIISPKATAPRVVTEVRYEIPNFSCAAYSLRGEAPIANVMVLERTRVAGYDAAVLAANDPAALNRWLAGTATNRGRP